MASWTGPGATQRLGGYPTRRDGQRAARKRLVHLIEPLLDSFRPVYRSVGCRAQGRALCSLARRQRVPGNLRYRDVEGASYRIADGRAARIPSELTGKVSEGG